ncbi:hypothetical protein Tco_0140688 [Tanacetum coccineum]
MASMTSSSANISNHIHNNNKNSFINHTTKLNAIKTTRINCSTQLTNNNSEDKPQEVNRREVILRSSGLAVLGAIFHFSWQAVGRCNDGGGGSRGRWLEKAEEVNENCVMGDIPSSLLSPTVQLTVSVVVPWKTDGESVGNKPTYLGVQKKPPALALCPATDKCISTSENISDSVHYAPPWNYNPNEGRGSMKPVTKEVAMEELLEVIKSTKPDNFTPRIVDRKDDYVLVEYESPILGFVDDVEFWFPPGKKPLVQYRSASRIGLGFDANRKRVKPTSKKEQGLDLAELEDLCSLVAHLRLSQKYRNASLTTHEHSM